MRTLDLRLPTFLLALNVLALCQHGWAGPMVSFGAHWNNFAFEPVEEGDPVANFYGVGGELNLGYSLGGIFDTTAWGSYTPASRYNVEAGKEDAVLWSYGGKFGFNIWKSMYLTFQGGQYTYELIFNERDTELDGRWSGPGGGLSLGGIFPGKSKNKTGAWRLGVDYTHCVMKEIDAGDDLENSERKLDVFAVSLTYVLMSKSRGSGFGFFDDFLKSIF